jgi:hypothetical protein
LCPGFRTKASRRKSASVILVARFEKLLFVNEICQARVLAENTIEILTKSGGHFSCLNFQRPTFSGVTLASASHFSL